MVRGFSGGPAVQYLRLCEDALGDAHDVIGHADRRCGGLVVPARRAHLPYASSSAGYSGPTVPEGSGVTRCDEFASTACASQLRVLGPHLGREFLEMAAMLDDIAVTDLGLPQVCIAVQFTTELVRAAAGPFSQTYEEFELLLGEHRDAMLGIAGGSEGVEFSVSLAGQCRREVKAVLGEQARLMRDMAQDVRVQIGVFEADAARQLTISQSARNLVHDSDGVPRWVDDWAAQAEARREHERLTGEITSFTNTARMLDEGADRLDRAVITTGRTYDANADEILSTDARFAERMAVLVDAMSHHARKFEQIADSICTNTGSIDLVGMFTAANMLPKHVRDELLDSFFRFPSAAEMFELAVEAELDRLRGILADGSDKQIGLLVAGGVEGMNPATREALARLLASSTPADIHRFFLATERWSRAHANSTAEWLRDAINTRVYAALSNPPGHRTPEWAEFQDLLHSRASVLLIADVLANSRIDPLLAREAAQNGITPLATLDLTDPPNFRYQGQLIESEQRVEVLLRVSSEPAFGRIAEVFPVVASTTPGTISWLSTVGDVLEDTGEAIARLPSLTAVTAGGAVQLVGYIAKGIANAPPIFDGLNRWLFGTAEKGPFTSVSNISGVDANSGARGITSGRELTENAYRIGAGVLIQPLPNGGVDVLLNFNTSQFESMCEAPNSPLTVPTPSSGTGG